MKQEKKEEAEFFNKTVNESDWDWMGRYGSKTLTNYFRLLTNPKKKEKLLDAGCGTAEFTSKLKKFDLLIYGMDISSKAIESAKKKNKDILFYVGDIENTGFKNSSFDIIVFSGVLHHFPDFSNVLKEAYRILKPGGRIFAYDPHYYNPIMWLFRYEKSPLSSKRNRTKNEKLLKKDELKKQLLDAGFSEIKVISISGITYNIKYFKKLFSFPFYYLVYFYNLFELIISVPFLQKKIGSFLLSYAKK